MREHDAHQKLKMKTLAESRRPIKDSDIQVGDTVLVKQPKTGKFSTPYHPVPLKVTNKSHSMLTAEGGDRSVTKIMQIQYQLTSTQVRSQYQLTQTQVQTQYQLTPAQVQSAQAELPLRRSAPVSKPPRRLIQGM